jgi:arabinan endo-1,5-alpha-L-arabinosidase
LKPGLSAALLLGAVAALQGQPRPNDTEIPASALRLGISVHDPSILQVKGRTYLFGSHMDSAWSDDLKSWTSFSHGVSPYNGLLDNLFTDPRPFQYVGINEQGAYSVWAPDVIYNPVNRKYLMYFCTTSTYVKSTLCLAEADKPEGPYHFTDVLLYSGFTSVSVDQTDVARVVGSDTKRYFNYSRYQNNLWPNAIDPSVFFDAQNRFWMVYGSWSGGIFLLELDPRTGRVLHPAADPTQAVDPYFGRHLAGGRHNSIEGPFILPDPTSGYYYLFVSYGGLNRTGGYQIREFRSRNPWGPYVDKKGQELENDSAPHSNYGVKLLGNFWFPSLSVASMAPGGQSAAIDPQGRILLVHHTRFDNGTEYHEPRIRQMFRTADGWLVTSPFVLDEAAQQVAAPRADEVAGWYSLVDQGTDIGPQIHRGEWHRFMTDGQVEDAGGQRVGSWSLSDGSIQIEMADTRYEGVVVDQKDEAGNPVRILSALSDQNSSLWAVRYQP